MKSSLTPSATARDPRGLNTSIAKEHMVDQVKDEKVPLDYAHCYHYKNLVNIEVQIDILRSYWPKLNPDGAIRYARKVYPTLQLPSWVEGPFAVIRPRFFSENDGEEIVEVLSALTKSRNGNFTNHRFRQMNRFRRHGHTVVAYDRIVDQQRGSDILVVGSQFGLRHYGRSISRVREVITKGQGEFGEGAKNVGTMLLTNPDRFAHSDDHWIDCSGDEFDDPDSGVRFGQAPYYYPSGVIVGVRFGTHFVDSACGHCGSASSFLPQN